jgi:hypothetical protein
VLTEIAFEIEAESILSSLRIPPGSERAREIHALLDAVRPILKPKAVYDVCYIQNKARDSVDLGGVTFTSRVLRVNLEEAGRVFPFIATCGREVAERAASCDDIMLKFCLDTVMEAALRAAIRHVVETVRDRYALGKTSAMNPGSLEDWPLSQQRQLFSLFGDVERLIGVELTDSFLMVPLKSVSGIIFPTEVRFESCQLCPRAVCPNRRAKYEPELWEKRYGPKAMSKGRQDVQDR